MKIIGCKKGISAIIVSLIILAVSLGMAVTYASIMMGWFGGASTIVKIDTTDTKVILNPNSGYTKFQLVIRNLGTATIKVKQVKIDLEGGSGTITFAKPLTFKLSTDGGDIIPSGEIYVSSTSVTVSDDGTLIIPPGQAATLYADITDGKTYWSIGKSYRGTIFYEGGVVIFKYSVESY